MLGCAPSPVAPASPSDPDPPAAGPAGERAAPRALWPTAAERALLDRVGEAEGAMLARARAWARINSGSHHRAGLERMRAALAEAFAELGGALEELPLPPREELAPDGTRRWVDAAPALRLRKRPEATVRVALTGHYDTVYPADDPFQDVTEPDAETLRGPGVADMKGGLVVMREALLALERSPDAARLGWEVLLSPDEELGSPSSRPALAALGAWAQVGLTFEPAHADGALVGARKGTGRLALLVRGRAAHSGREPRLGRNALVAAARFAAAIDALDGARDGLTVNVARLDGGGPLNVVPALAVCRFELRARTREDWCFLEERLARLVAEAGDGDGLRVELVRGPVRPPKPLTPATLALLEATRAVGAGLGLPLDWRDSGGASEGNDLEAAGCPCVDSLGVRGGGLHSREEYAVRASFVERARLAALLLMKLASGEIDPTRLRGPTPC